MPSKITKRQKSPISFPGQYSGSKVIRFEVTHPISLRDQELQSLFPNTHSLKDDTLGDCAVNIRKIAKTSERESLLRECTCASCSRKKKGCSKIHVCDVCAIAGIRTFKKCEKQMRVHINRE